MSIFSTIFAVLMLLAIAYVVFKDEVGDSVSRYIIILFIIIGCIGLVRSTYIEISNPCIEFEDTCEVECWGEGTPAYDCVCIYPCKKRKND